MLSSPAALSVLLGPESGAHAPTTPPAVVHGPRARSAAGSHAGGCGPLGDRLPFPAGKVHTERVGGAVSFLAMQMCAGKNRLLYFNFIIKFIVETLVNTII